MLKVKKTMQINIIAVGKVKENYLKAGIEEYLKRLTSYAKVKIIEVSEEGAPEDIGEKEKEKILLKEGERILSQIKEGDYLIVLDIKGDNLSSEQLAAKINNLALYGKSSLTFLIGSSYGLSNEVKRRADYSLSFSRLTFPHQLIRLILLEQIYRTFKINRNEPYHK